uniref:Uncharacterized protein n=1 Tax=Anguilla anguilla TaxID=7936 RepID=A0A0E9P7W1_ANGAN
MGRVLIAPPPPGELGQRKRLQKILPGCAP